MNKQTNRTAIKPEQSDVTSTALDNVAALRSGTFASFAQSILDLPNQCEQVLKDAPSFKLPASYRQVTSAVVNGMGGSGLGADILQSVFADRLKNPLTLTHDYTVPQFVGPQTLFVACSYSGGTEETVASLERAVERKAHAVVIAIGGKLAAAAKQHGLPVFQFEPRFNPSGQPRLGLGYTLTALWAVLGKANVLPFGPDDAAHFRNGLAEAGQRFGFDVPTERNPAKQLAWAMHGRQALLIAGTKLAGNTHTFANQCNESAKHWVHYAVLPELNHHLLEGLVHPEKLSQRLVAVFLQSPLDPPRIQKRFQVTRDVFEKQGFTAFSYQAAATDAAALAGEMLQLSGSTSFYLAALNRVPDPNAIPWVDYFKAQLGKHPR